MVSMVWVVLVVWEVSGSLCYRWYSSLSIAPYYNCGTQVAVVTRYRISNYFHTTISFNSGSKVAVVTRYQLPNYFHITTYPLTPLHKSSPPPSAVPFLLSCKPSIGVTEVTQSQNSNYIHLTYHVYDSSSLHLSIITCTYDEIFIFINTRALHTWRFKM